MNENSRERRTLAEVLDLETGEVILANDFFELPEDKIFSKRKELEIAIQGKSEPKFVCIYCKEHIKICGRPLSVAKKIKYFSHLREGEDCLLRSQNGLTREEIQRIKYNGAKESELHIKLKGLIATNLTLNQEAGKGITKVEVEKVYRSKSLGKAWRKPDVSAKYNDTDIVFELQLSTTFLSVIVSRESYYSENQTYILWVFHRFDTNLDLQRFTDKDIFYSNNRNAFVINDEAQKRSVEENDLVLLCYYQEPVLNGRHIRWEWQSKYIILNDLTFNATGYKVFFFDSDGAYNKLREKVAEMEAIEAKEREEVEQKRLAIKRTEYVDAQIEPILTLLRDWFSTGTLKHEVEIKQKIQYLSKDERRYLSTKVVKEFKGKPFLHYLLNEPKHNHFTNFILGNTHIDVEANIEDDGVCCLEVLFDSNQHLYDKLNLIILLYSRGYDVMQHRSFFLRLTSELAKPNLSFDQMANGYRYAAIVQLNNYGLICKYKEIETIIYALYSVRFGKLIGSKLPNMIALATPPQPSRATLAQGFSPCDIPFASAVPTTVLPLVRRYHSKVEILI
jgi:hypothetical protein